MADSGLETPVTSKRKRREKKRRWEWTLGPEDGNEDEVENAAADKTHITAFQIEYTPITAISRGVSASNDGSGDGDRYVPVFEGSETDMDDSDSVASVQSEPAPHTLQLM